ncbi:hypothetical protein LINGRAHAP2_LOCUS2797 [Linum grandiflorum]
MHKLRNGPKFLS